jgi:hypothetical protein
MVIDTKTLRCKYCKKGIVRHIHTWVTSGGSKGTREYYDLIGSHLRLGHQWYHYHQPMSEVEEVQELLREYPPPQKKNPFVEKSRPWDTKWRKRKR